MSELAQQPTHLDPAQDPLARIWPRVLHAPDASPLADLLLTRHVAGPLWELMDRGGRRWRPLIVRLAFEAAGGRPPVDEALFQVVELLHHGSLVVDDIEDGAPVRRGGPAVHVAHGIPTAINAANAAYFKALHALRGLLPDAQRLRALDMLSHELWNAHLGQAMDLSLGDAMLEGQPVSTADYRSMAEAKTGALVRMAARLGAIAADSSAACEGALSAWATRFGLAYQMTDDAVDLAEDALRPGACRMSYPVLLALQRTAGTAQQRLRALLAKPADAEDAAAGEQLLALVTGCGALQQAREDAAQLARAALDELRPLPAARPLQDLTHTWLLGSAP
jgi:geranylgeranyl diphosphate synthase type I